MKLLEAPTKIKWNDALRKIYSRFPSAIRSKRWAEIAKLALSGDTEGATRIGQELEDGSKNAQIENTSANRLRQTRVTLFSRLAQAERTLRVMFDRIGTSLANKVEKKGATVGKIPSLNDDIKATTTELRQEIRKWLRGVIKDSTVFGLKNPGDAFKASFKKAQEQIEDIEIEQMILSEASKKFIPLKNLGNRVAKIATTTQKFSNITKRVMKTILTSNASGQDPRDLVVELTQRLNNELRRTLANGIAQGKSTQKIARDIKKFISPAITKAVVRGEVLPAGIYRSPFKNAMRIARTEANKAYTHASAEWAKDKSFIQGVIVTLSPSHDGYDECDSLANEGVMSPERFQRVIPAHPHCMCYATYVYEDKFLDKEA